MGSLFTLSLYSSTRVLATEEFISTMPFFETRRSLNHYNSSQLRSSLTQCTPPFFDAGETHSLTILCFNSQMSELSIHFLAVLNYYLLYDFLLQKFSSGKREAFSAIFNQYVYYATKSNTIINIVLPAYIHYKLLSQCGLYCTNTFISILFTLIYVWGYC